MANAFVPLCSELRHRHEVRLIAAYRRERLDQGLGDSVRWIPAIPVPGLNLLVFALLGAFALPAQLIRFRPHVVLFDPGAAFACLGPALVSRALRRGACFILDVRTLPISHGKPAREVFERGLFRTAIAASRRLVAGFTTLSTSLADELRDKHGLRDLPVGIWSSGVDASLFSRDPYPRSAPHSGLRLIYHGGILRTRGLFELVDAVALARARQMDVSLTILGDGPDKGVFEAYVGSLGLGDAIRLHPPVPLKQVPLMLSQADVGAIPLPDLACWRTSSPLKLGEYLAMEMPVLVTDMPCHRQVLGDAPFAVYARSSRAQDLADAIEEACREKQALLASAPGARQLACSSLTWGSQAARFESFVAERCR